MPLGFWPANFSQALHNCGLRPTLSICKQNLQPGLSCPLELQFCIERGGKFETEQLDSEMMSPNASPEVNA